MNAHSLSYATTSEQRIDELRHVGVRLAVTTLRHGRPYHALGILLGSVEAQARVAGISCELELE
jgi:hypothetical protein